MKRIIFIITVALLCRGPELLSQFKEPGRPDIPEINNELEGFKFRVRIALQGRDGFIEGEMISNSDFLTTDDNKNIKIKDISRINVLTWEKRSRMNKHSFYPSRYELFYNDYRKVILNGNIESLNRIRIGRRKPPFVYLYYYDYFENGKWINSGVSGYDALIDKPAPGCAVSIELI